MKRTPHFILFCIICLACEEKEPSISSTPVITLQNYAFVDTEGAFRADTVRLTFSYADGDGDLGLNTTDITTFQAPYNQFVYHQGSLGQLLPVNGATIQLSAPGSSFEYVDLIEVTNPATGDLVFPRTRKNSLFTNQLPAYSCENYLNWKFVIPKSQVAVLDEFTEFLDTLSVGGEEYYMFRDSLYVEINPAHYNIEVDFLVEQPGGSFTEFDWRKESCVTFDARFPETPFTKNGPFSARSDSKEKGEITYTMASFGFKALFGGKKVKLRFNIKDRALHVSNTIETSAIQF